MNNLFPRVIKSKNFIASVFLVNTSILCSFCASSDNTIGENIKEESETIIKIVSDDDKTCVGNPLIRTMYTADPTARVMNGKLFLFPSTDIDDPNGKDKNGFRMPYYHIFSTENLIDWTDYGRQIDQNNISWITKNSNAMWAPDCVEKNGKFYYYFPTWGSIDGGKCKIGVCIADKPEGPYTMPKEPMEPSKLDNIDPNIFIDDDGKAYIYFGGGRGVNNLKMASLKSNMIEVDGDVSSVKGEGYPDTYKEASFVFKRNGIYYHTFSCSLQGNCVLAYAMGNSPKGPFKYVGPFMEKWNDCWTNHHSFVEYKGEWILFYHHNDISKKDKLRSACADYVHFNADGTIKMVTPTMRGIGVCSALKRMDIDRYNNKSSNLNITRRGNQMPANWQIEKAVNGSWLTFNNVNFPNGVKNVQICCSNESAGGTIEIRESNNKGKLIAKIDIPAGKSWNDYVLAETQIINAPSGKVNLFFSFTGENKALYNIDWIRFTK